MCFNKTAICVCVLVVQDITMVMRMFANVNIDHLDELHIGEDFKCYTECKEQYFIANNVPKTKKVAAFLSALGAKVYKLL